MVARHRHRLCEHAPLLLGTLNGILAAIVVSVLVLMYHANRPPVYLMGRKPGTDVFRPLSGEHPEDETTPGLLLVRTEGRLHFANVQCAGEKIWPLIHSARPRVVALELSAVPDIEYTALRGLSRLERKLGEVGSILWLVALNPEVLRVVERAPIGQVIGRDRMFVTLPLALEHYRSEAWNPGLRRRRAFQDRKPTSVAPRSGLAPFSMWAYGAIDEPTTHAASRW